MQSYILPTDRVALIAQLAMPEMPQHIDGGAAGSIPLPGDAAQRVWAEAASNTVERRMLYLHVPFCRSRCSFCGFYMNPTTEDSVRGYTELVLRELERACAQDACVKGPIQVVYFGGGTPTDLTAEGLYRIIRCIRARFALTADVEFTVEGRLFGFDDAKVGACLEAGATRFSFGIQTFDTMRRQRLGRRLTREEILNRLQRIKAMCGDRVAVIADLIYGLPGQTQTEWLEDIRTVLEDVPLDGVDLYRLKLLPGIPLLAQVKREVALTEEDVMQRYEQACIRLQGSGWRRLSIAHWGRTALERNRYNHWAKTDVDILPFGCGAGGSLGDWSFMQTATLEEYRAQVEAGVKPLAVAMRKTTSHRLKAQVIDQMERGFLDPKNYPAVDFRPLYENWFAAGLWAEDECGCYRLSALGEFYQTRLAAWVLRFYLSQLPKELS